MIRCVPSDQDAVTNMIIAATKTSEPHWLSKLPGWAPETTEEYTVNAFIEDMTKEPGNEVYQLKNDLGPWELVDWKAIAVMTDLEIPKEYEWY